ncbi:MAG: retropepsin-like aspartic protease [Caldilineaceae bacterium]
MQKRVYTFDYDQSYDPPFPAIQIGISTPEQPQTQRQLTVLVDSGSDGTLLPSDVLRAIGATYVDHIRVQGLFGGRRSVALYMVQLQIGPYTIYAVQVGATNRKDEVVLGRNVLNQLDITLRGSAGVVEIQG